MTKATFSILITTKNRKEDLILTLNSIRNLLEGENCSCVVFDDGSSDGTHEYVATNFSQIKLERNEVSKGYIFCRNKMLNETKADFAISLDDDAHFVTANPLEILQEYFDENSKCGLAALRIFWGLQEPISKTSDEKIERVQGYVGCGHVWRMTAWRTIPSYPEWFVFYGEENFASFQLYKKGWEINYLPEILVNHRVDVKSRKKNSDFITRLRRSLRSGWYLFFLFYPRQRIPRIMGYSLWIQFKTKVFKGDFKALLAIGLALMDLVLNMPKFISNKNRLTVDEFEDYQNLGETKIYWNPKIKL